MIFKDGISGRKSCRSGRSLKADGYDFSVGIDIDTPIIEAERVVRRQGSRLKENMKLIEKLAKAAGAAVGSSRPVAEQLMYVPSTDTLDERPEVYGQSLYSLRNFRREPAP